MGKVCEENRVKTQTANITVILFSSVNKIPTRLFA